MSKSNDGVAEDTLKLAFEVAKHLLKTLSNKRDQGMMQESLIDDLEIKIKNSLGLYSWYEKAFFNYEPKILFTEQDALLVSKVINEEFHKEDHIHSMSCIDCITRSLRGDACNRCRYKTWTGEIDNQRKFFSWSGIPDSTSLELSQVSQLQPIVSKQFSSYFI